MIKIRVSYETPEQLKTVLSFLDPILVSHKEEPGLFGEKRRAYITVQV